MSRGLTVGLLLCALSTPFSAAGQAGDTLVVDLAEAERRALENHPLLEGPRAELEVVRAQRTQASNARILPELNLRNVWGPIPRQRGEFTESGVLFSPDSTPGISDLRWFTQLDLQLLQPIYGFGKASTRIEAADRRVDVTEAELETVRADVRLQVAQAYWGVVLGRELEGVVEGVLDRVEEADSILQARYEQGDATQNDRFKFQIFRYEVSSRRREGEARLREARAGLRAAMGLDESRPFRVESGVLEPVDVELEELDTYLDMAAENRPELRQLRAGVAARRSLAEAEERDRWPTLFAGAEVTVNQAPSRFDPENPFWDDQTNFARGGVVVGLDWDLNFLHHRDEARVARYEAQRLEAQRDPLLARIEQDVRSAFLEARRTRADVEDGEEALQASQNWLRAELQTYDIGIGDIEDVIDAFRSNAEMEVEQLRNIAAFNIAVAELSRRVGRNLRP